ncbi:MAG: LD-carboxypeptidase [Calditrichaeota bacterium]|nr:MAG: LD-carboxypeptidase [Calditrichota bacterium]
MSLPVLNPGDAIGLVSPAGAVRREQVQPGIDYLTSLGYICKLGQHAFSDNGLTSAPVERRLEDLHTFVADEEVKVIWALRGGYGSIQLLDRLEYGLFRGHPKILVGFSDITALQWALYARLGLPSLSGLTLTTQTRPENRYVSVGLEILSGRRKALVARDLSGESVQAFRSGEASGTLMAGTLSMICTLCGTPFWPKAEPIILALEDVNEPLYRIDRYFQQLRLMGFWENVAGLLLGKFLLDETEQDVLPLITPLVGPEVPIVYNLPYGHFSNALPFPSGVAARLQAEPFRLEWKGS